jgi:predicted HNH restriction endonuclease
MTPALTLVQSSPTTRSWLQSLRDRLPELEYSEAKYYAAFKTEPPRRAVAFLNPAQRSVRSFLALDPSEPDLRQTPSTSTWAKRFPAVFQIAGEQDLTRAGQLILKSGKALGPLIRKKAKPRPEHFAAEELLPEVEYLEGAVSHVLVNAYERNRRAREACLRHYGRSCAACGFNFETNYGETMAGYIHVHHVIPIAQVGAEYRLHPIEDLRPVCANCHAVIHRREPPFSIEEIKDMLRNSG